MASKVNIPKLPAIDFDRIGKQFRDLDYKDAGTWPVLPKITALVVLLLVLVAAGFYFYWMPKWEELDKGRAEEVKLKKEHEDKLRQAISLDALRKQKEQVAQFVFALEKQLPNKTQMAALLTEINKSGSGRGIQFLLFRPAGEVVKQFYAEQPIDIGITGNYHDIGTFASDIATLSPIVTLNKIDIKAPANDKETALTMSAEVKAYRYLDPEEQAAAKKAASAAGAKK